MRVCIAVPMYNEEDIARHSIETILDYTKQLPPVVTILVINDGSIDTTGSIVAELVDQVHDDQYLRLVSHKVNMGYGAAQKTALKIAADHNYDYIVFMDCDLTDDPKYLLAFYDKMVEGWDYIKTSRFVDKGGYRNVPFRRRIVAKYGNIFAKIVSGLPLTDIVNGFRAAKVDILKQVDLTENHFSIIVEEIMKVKNITNSFCEIPRIQGTRDIHARASSFKYNFRTYWKYLKYLFV
jgi:dolichol-phosphate mannosyltransferase